MVDMPQPDEQETVDGCPVLHVSDTEREFEIFLDMLYNGLESVVLFTFKFLPHNLPHRLFYRFRKGRVPPPWEVIVTQAW